MADYHKVFLILPFKNILTKHGSEAEKLSLGLKIGHVTDYQEKKI